MPTTLVGRGLVIGLLLSVFFLGYVCGALNQRPAHAQGVGGLLEQAEKAGGPLAAAKELGSSIAEMQQHVSGLQKNLDALQKVRAALSGSK